jgi:hypothetical protein
MLRTLRALSRISSQTLISRNYVAIKRAPVFLKSNSFINCSRYLATKTSVDQEFSALLKEEIQMEKDLSRKSPTAKASPPKGYKVVKQNGSEFILQRQFEDGVVVEVLLDLAGSVSPPSDVPEEEDIAHMHEQHQSMHGSSKQGSGTESKEEEAEGQPLLARPDFRIRLIKPNCTHSVCFHCSFAHESNDVGDLDNDAVDMPSFSVDSVQMASPKATTTDLEKGYFVYADLFDDNVFEHTMRLLMDRGIDGQFEQELVEFCTSQEHVLYLNFLSQLESYCRSH